LSGFIKLTIKKMEELETDCGPGLTMGNGRCDLAEPSQQGATPHVENKIRQINIEELNRGFIVRVGCHTFAISTRAELTTKLTEYINEPIKTEKKWYKGDLF
jgi:hypothetical protein